MDYFQLEVEQTPPTDIAKNYFDYDYATTQCEIYPRYIILQYDENTGWTRPIPDSISMQGPFIATHDLKVGMESK